ncbi:MAG: hypothetical protein ACPGYY_06380 [Bacteroidia bacterium]
MKKTTHILLFIFLSSCFKPDEQIPKIWYQQAQVHLDHEKSRATYIDLDNLSKNNNSEEQNWQLKFQNTPKGWSIYLNALEQVAVHNTKETDFDKVDQTYFNLDIPWQIDIPTSSGAYPAIGTWGDFNFPNPKSFKNVYLVSWTDGNTSFVDKIQILDASEDAYHIRYSRLEGGEIKSAWISKEANYTHSYFSLLEGRQVKRVEPSIDNWDLCFTYFSDSISSHTLPHVVETINPDFGIYHGALINYEQNKVCIDSTSNFDDIDYFYASKLEFEQQDQIFNLFYHWDEQSQRIILDKNLSLIVKNQDKYFAVKPRKLTNEGTEGVSMTLKVKQL